MRIPCFLLALIIFPLATGCNREKQSSLPVLTTSDITGITTTSAKSGGVVESTDHDEIIAKGVCWDVVSGLPLADKMTMDGVGSDDFVSSMTGLTSGTKYYVKAYATTNEGTSYGNEISFTTLSSGTGQIIADHTVVDRYDDIPQNYIDEVKKMWLVYAGESHARAIRVGLENLEALDPRFAVSVVESGTPEALTSSNLRASSGTRGDYTYTDRWIYNYGEEDWFTNSTALSRTKAGITYCNTHSLEISAIGFGWCYDDTYNIQSQAVDPVYGCHWYGRSVNGPDGSTCWGLNADDFSITGNRVSMDTYLSATQEYIDYCEANGYMTKVFFTTGPVEPTYYKDERGYQGSIKHQYIREYVKKDPERILFDYADILYYDNDGKLSTDTWNGHTFPVITPTNYGDESIGHIGEAGALRLAKAMWWMLARMAGWDGK